MRVKLGWGCVNLLAGEIASLIHQIEKWLENVGRHFPAISGMQSIFLNLKTYDAAYVMADWKTQLLFFEGFIKHGIIYPRIGD
jgi:hypothetical protein